MCDSSLLGPGGSPWCGVPQVSPASCFQQKRCVLISCSGSAQQRCAGPGKQSSLFAPFTPQKTVHVASPSSLVDEELTMRYRFTFWLKLFVKLWAKRWSYSECCCLRRCSSWLERLVCCALILAGPMASQWSGKKLCWKWEYLCFGGAYTAEIISSETFETISDSRELRA